MFNFLKSNNPAAIIFYVIYLLLFRVCFGFVTADTTFVFEHTEPLSRWVFVFLQNIPGHLVVSLTLSAVLCFIQALLVNNIVIENKILPKKNYLAGALFIIFASFFKESILLTPATIALTFIILCTARLFSLVKKEKSYGDVFDAGFLIAIATLFYFPCVLFILFTYIGLAMVRPFNYREWTIVMLGFIAPFFLVFTCYYWVDKAGFMFANIANMHAGGWLHNAGISISDKIMIGGMALAVIISLLLLPGALYSSLIQVRKFANALVVLIVFVFVAIPLQQTIHLSHLVMLALPIGIISSMALMQIKRGWISEVTHIILLLLVLSGQFFPYFNSN